MSTSPAAQNEHSPGTSTRLTAITVWDALDHASFAVVSCATRTGAPRSSGVLYTLVDRTMYVAVANDSWKAKHISANGRVAVTVPVRRGGLLALLLPIPPATISFHGLATVRPADDHPLPGDLADLIPPSRRGSVSIVEIRPEDDFLTYGIGVALRQMRAPDLARARVPVTDEMT